MFLGRTYTQALNDLLNNVIRFHMDFKTLASLAENDPDLAWVALTSVIERNLGETFVFKVKASSKEESKRTFLNLMKNGNYFLGEVTRGCKNVEALGCDEQQIVTGLASYFETVLRTHLGVKGDLEKIEAFCRQASAWVYGQYKQYKNCDEPVDWLSVSI